MKLTANFKLYPSVDVYTPVSLIYGMPDEEWVVDSPEDYQEKLIQIRAEGKPSPTKMRPRLSMQIDEKIDRMLAGEKFTDEEWRHLHFVRFPGRASVMNYTKEDLEIPGIPVVKWETRAYKAYNEVDGRDKVICLTQGVIMFRHLWKESDPTVLRIVNEILKKQTPKHGGYHGDVELDGKKVFGCINAQVKDGFMATDGILTFDYDETIFSKLPKQFYSRSYHKYKKEGEQGITGLIQEIPGFNINAFMNELIERLGYGNRPVLEGNMAFLYDETTNPGIK